MLFCLYPVNILKKVPNFVVVAVVVVVEQVAAAAVVIRLRFL